MPEAPDFEQIARRIANATGVGRLEAWDATDTERVVTAIAEQLRLIWNARGNADLATKRRWDRNQYAQIRALDR